MPLGSYLGMVQELQVVETPDLEASIDFACGELPAESMNIYIQIHLYAKTGTTELTEGAKKPSYSTKLL